MFDIKRITFSNLLSYGNKPTTIDFTDFNTLMITGKNGAGKSCWSESIFFGLYGRTYRKITLDQLVNNVNKKKLNVKIEFENNGNQYIIERGLKPKKLKFWKNGEEQKEGVSKNEYQKEIDKAIGIDYKVFTQLCLVDNSFYQPFMSLKTNDKRQIIDNIFGLVHITDMASKCKDYKTKIQEKILTVDNIIKITQEKIRINKQFNEDNIKKDIDCLSKEIEKSKEDGRKNIKDIKNIKLDIEKKINLIDKKENKLLSIRDNCNNLIYDIKRRDEEIDLHKQGKCDRCKRAFENPESEIKKFEIEKKSFQKELENENIIKENIQKEQTILNNELNKLESSLQSLKQSNATLRTIIEKDSDRLDKLHKKEKDFDTSNLDKELKISEKEYKKHFTMFNRFKKCETILSDSGIRSYIIKKYLPVFNKSLKSYLRIMEATFSFEFDSSFNQKVDSRYRTSMSYESLSSGQRARINMAILFSLIEFAEKKSGSRLNILILDEIIDGLGLDTQGKESILSILMHSIKKKMLVISHSSQVQDSFDKSAKVELNGSFSQIKML